ncbi:MAG: hypothetical protein HYX76_04950 [Acidobacteria bacterium]|nr:hypothetical protein [Acidobacteriota bacterium]
MRILLIIAALCCQGPAPVPQAAILPPSAIYHFGQREHLVQDAKADTVPEEVWATFIVGDSSNFKLPPFRRGLYGTTHPAFADNFGQWFMAVHLKQECRTPEAVVIPSDLYADPRVKTWFEGHPRLPIAGFDAFTQQCFRKSLPLESQETRLYLQVENVAPGVGYPGTGVERTETPCERVLQQLYADIRPRVILDEQWMEQKLIGVNLANHLSWYIRDRDCIESIEGEETDVVRMFADVPDFWDDQLLLRADVDEDTELVVESSKTIRYAYPLRMLMIALAQAPDSASIGDLRKIRRDAQEGYQQLWPLDRNAHTLVPPVVDAFVRCRSTANVQAFQREIPRGDFDPKLIPEIVERLKGICLE